MNDSPESEVAASWLECSIYQNYTASEVLVQVNNNLLVILNTDSFQNGPQIFDTYLEGTFIVVQLVPNVWTLDSDRF